MSFSSFQRGACLVPYLSCRIRFNLRGGKKKVYVMEILPMLRKSFVLRFFSESFPEFTPAFSIIYTEFTSLLQMNLVFCILTF